MKEQHSLIHATVLLTGVGLVSQGLAFFYRAALARLVGAETLGLYQLIMPVYAVIQSVIMSGLTVALSSLTAGMVSQSGQKSAVQLLYSALRMLLLLWVPAACVVGLTSELLAEKVLGDARTELGLLLLLPVLLLTGVENLHKHHFYGMGETRLPARVELAEQFIRTGAILGMLALLLPLPQSHAVGVIVLGMLVSEVFSSVTLVFLRLRREGPLRRQSGQGAAPGDIRRRLLGVALPVSGAALCNNLIGSANSILIPQRLVVFGMSEPQAVEAFGVVFGMTLPMLTMPTAFVNALCLALLPRLTHCAAMKQTQRMKELASGSLRAVSLLLFPMLALVSVMGRDVGQLLFQEERVGGYLLPLAVEVGLSAWEGVLSTVLNGVGKQSVSAVINAACGGIQLAFTLLGVGLFGFPACLAGMILASVLGVLLRLAAAYQCFGLEIDVYTSFTAPLLSALLAGGWVSLLYQWQKAQELPPVLTLLLCTAAGAVLYLVSLAVQSALPSPFSLCKSSSHSSTQRNRMT